MKSKGGTGGKTNALFIGRFQPFHNGHLKVIRDILEENRKITILIGGPGKPDEKNPFSFSERERMIRLALRSEGIEAYSVHRVSNVNDDDRWNAKIRGLGSFDVAYSRNPWVARCLRRIGIPVKKHAFYQRYKNCGRVIRRRIIEGKDWKPLVPAGVYKYIRRIDGEKRIGGNY
jgi:nicotinamide-nucleotide adenylyltransferase